jgi:hypothetical protein
MKTEKQIFWLIFLLFFLLVFCYKDADSKNKENISAEYIIIKILKNKFPNARIKQSTLSGDFYTINSEKGKILKAHVLSPIQLDLNNDGTNEIITCIGIGQQEKTHYTLSVFELNRKFFKENVIKSFKSQSRTERSYPSSLRLGNFTGRKTPEVILTYLYASAGNRGGASEEITYIFKLKAPYKNILKITTEKKQWYDSDESSLKNKLEFKDVDKDKINEIIITSVKTAVKDGQPKKVIKKSEKIYKLDRAGYFKISELSK